MTAQMQPSRKFRRRPFNVTTAFPTTDREKLDFLREGKAINFPPLPDEAEGPEAAAARTIRASQIEGLVEKPSGICRVSIEISNAIIEGPLNLPYSSFEYSVSFANCIFTDQVDFSLATFKRSCNLSGSRFHGRVLMGGAYIRFYFTISNAAFFDESTFIDLQIDDTLTASGAFFKTAIFYRMKVAKPALFTPVMKNDRIIPVIFAGEALFDGAEFNGNAYFDGVQFGGTASFQSINAARNLFFRPFDEAGKALAVMFGGKTRFNNAKVQSEAIFSGARFKGVASFNRIRVNGNLIFKTIGNEKKAFPTRFRKLASFNYAHVEGNADFSGAQFKENFECKFLDVEGNLWCHPIKTGHKEYNTFFGGEATFYRAHILGNAEFPGASFKKAARFLFLRVEGEAIFHTKKAGNRIYQTTFSEDTTFDGARIQGNADFRGVLFEQSADFGNSTVTGDMTFRPLAFEMSLYFSTFKQAANFYGSTIQGDISFEGVHFESAAVFNKCKVEGRFIASSILMADHLIYARFLGDAQFIDADIHGPAEFIGTQFHGKASFIRAKIDTSALFRNIPRDNAVIPTRFNDKVDFSDVHIEGSIVFDGARFNKDVDFARASIGGNFRFNFMQSGNFISPTQFRGNASFVGANVKGSAIFSAAQFRKQVSFERIQIGDIGFFRAASVGDKVIPIRFHESTTFLSAHFSGADFNGAEFRGEAIFRLIKIDRAAYFNAHFYRRADFDRASIEGMVRMEGATFDKLLELREAHFQSVIFYDKEQGEPVKTAFKGPVDLRGFSYARINADWDSLFSHIDPYDRQPYTYLEKTFRESGFDREAEKVYLQRRKRERKLMRSNKQELRAFSELIQWLLFNHGVRPYRLFWFSLGIVLLGTIMFAQPGAVKYKEDKAVIQTSETSQTTERLSEGSSETARQKGQTLQRTNQIIEENQGGTGLPWTRSLGYSLRLFIPIVELPTGSQWVPTENSAPIFHAFNLSFAGYATLHRLAGAILVPLGIAALAGLLYRKP